MAAFFEELSKREHSISIKIDIDLSLLSITAGQCQHTQNNKDMGAKCKEVKYAACRRANLGRVALVSVRVELLSMGRNSEA